LATGINRRNFLGLFGAGVPAILLPGAPDDSKASAADKEGRSSFADGWFDPPLEFSQAPFWFWNDALSEEEIVRQLEDFRAHGVYGFVIHPRSSVSSKTFGLMVYTGL